MEAEIIRAISACGYFQKENYHKENTWREGGKEKERERVWVEKEREQDKENQWQGFEKNSGGNMVFLIGI